MVKDLLFLTKICIPLNFNSVKMWPPFSVECNNRASRSGTGHLKYGKTGNKKHSTLLQNDLNSDIARFTTNEKKPLQPYSLQYRFERGL